MSGKTNARALVRGTAVVRLVGGTACSDGPLTRSESRLLGELQRQAIRYFLDNQLPHGLVLDRQRNHQRRSTRGLCSTSATGMGLVALALAAGGEYGMLSGDEARRRVRAGLETALLRLPADHGMLPHFVDAPSLRSVGADAISTIDTSWLAAGALVASALLDDPHLADLARRLYRRIDWRYWAGGGKDGGDLLLHGKGRNGRFLPHAWDRLNAETVFMYVLASGAPQQALPPVCWGALDPHYGSVAGMRFVSADLGLFVFQYSLELIDSQVCRFPGGIDLAAEAVAATRANYRACREAAAQFTTYRRYWGLSAGDGPGDDGGDAYRCYAPLGPVDGTAHLTATLASVGGSPEMVVENLIADQCEPRLEIRGRYGFSNVNVDRNWISRDMVGIDAGAAVLALDNFFHQGRLRRVFHSLECVQQGLARLNSHSLRAASRPSEQAKAA